MAALRAPREVRHLTATHRPEVRAFIDPFAVYLLDATYPDRLVLLGKVGRLSRGKYAERARRSIEILALDKKLVAALGGPDAVSTILRALAAALGERKPKKRRAA